MNVVSKQGLKEGTFYNIAIFDAIGEYKETKLFRQGNEASDFRIDKGKYTFVIYASGTNKTLPAIAIGAKLGAINLEGLSADQDIMMAIVSFEVGDGVNILNVDLEHLFTQVSLKFDATNLGEVTHIGGATIAPSYASVNIALANRAITYLGTSSAVPFSLKNTIGKVIETDPVFITTAATTDGTIVLADVSIAGSAPKTLIKGGNLNLE